MSKAVAEAEPSSFYTWDGLARVRT